MNVDSSQGITKVKVRDITVGGGKLAVAAGPCVLESYDAAYFIAEEMKKLLLEKISPAAEILASIGKAMETEIAALKNADRA